MTTNYLDPDRIKQNLKTDRIGSHVIVFNSTSSTNHTASKYAKNPENDGLAVFAEFQSKGKGRTGAKWLSKPHQSILCSVLLTHYNSSPELLSLATAIATTNAIGQFKKIKPQIKWPNDILINNKKTAGILLESASSTINRSFIIGIGINCHQKPEDFPSELKNYATSLDIESNRKTDRLRLAKRLLVELDKWTQITNREPQKIIDTWKEKSSLFGKRITIISDGQNFTGNCIGVAPQKGLILKLDHGPTRFFHASHSTIAK